MPLSYATGCFSFFFLFFFFFIVPEFVAVVVVFPENLVLACTMGAFLQVPLCNARIVFFARSFLVDISKFRAFLGEFSKAVLSPNRDNY